VDHTGRHTVLSVGPSFDCGSCFTSVGHVVLYRIHNTQILLEDR